MKQGLKVAPATLLDCRQILFRYHYLKDISKSFKSGVNIGVYDDQGRCLGVCIFTGLPVPELAQGMFGLARTNQHGLFELSRLCLTPESQAQHHNLASWFLARAIKMLRNQTKVRAILSYADADHHLGKVYQASNFQYFGLSAAKKDFWFEAAGGGGLQKLSRGSNKGLKGEWRDRSQKHRYLMIFDKTLKVKWQSQPYPKQN